MGEETDQEGAVPKPRGKFDPRTHSFSESTASSQSFLTFNMLSQDGTVC